MKKVILMSMMLTVVAVSSFAQVDRSVKKRSTKPNSETAYNQDSLQQKRGNRMAQELNLTPQQKTQLQTINSNFKSQLDDLRKQDNLTVKEMKSRRDSLIKQHQQAIKNVLTPEQYAKWEQKKQQHGHKPHGRHGFEGSGRRGAENPDL